MTTITIDHSGPWIVGFSAQGHTGFAEEGEDIVCAAVSAITQTAMLGVAHYAPDAEQVRREGDAPLLRVRIKSPTPQTQAILTAMLLGLSDLSAGMPEFVRVIHTGTEVESK